MQVGKWQKISELGSGAFGVVSLWRNNENQECSAIKMCKFKTKDMLTEKQKERWNNEVEIMKIINHSNIIKYKEIPKELLDFLMVNNPTGLPLLPMEYCRKGNLRHVLLKPENLSGLEEDYVRCILKDISSGLQHLHNLKITHRDLKPDNIVLQDCDDRKTKTIYKIIDLGYAKELGDSTVSFVGTLHYLAPEIFEAKNYNNSVDYWSMGVFTFEIISGTLPFLTNLTPFDKFEKIKQKAADNICMYLNYSGQISFSSEIQKENLISSCLKQNLEIWLRQVLTYDPEIRNKCFPNNIKTLDYLHKILKKNVINVFSVCKLEFYSYEITESTLIGTLKEWIARDIKICKTDLILLIPDASFDIHDNDLLSNVVKDNYVYVTQKYFLPKESYNFPKLIREVMKSAAKFNVKYLPQLKSQIIYFLTIEKRTAYHFSKSFHLYLNYLNHMLKTLNNLRTTTVYNLNQMMIKIDCYNKIKTRTGCDIDVSNNNEYKEHLNYAQRLLGSMERSNSNFIQLDNKIKHISKRLKVLSTVTPKIQDIIASYDLSDMYNQTLKVIEKTNDITYKNIPRINELLSKTTKIISDTIKVKTTVFKNMELKSFLNLLGNILTYCFKLFQWITDYSAHNKELLECFERNESAHFKILLAAAKKQSTSDSDSTSDQNSISDSLKEDLTSLPSSYLVLQNQELRYQFEEMLSSLSGFSLDR